MYGTSGLIEKIIPSFNKVSLNLNSLCQVPKGIGAALKVRGILRGRLHGAFSTPGLNSALFTGLKFQPCL
jgi:hypothetical protein